MSWLGKAGQEPLEGWSRGQQAGPEDRDTTIQETLGSCQGGGKTVEGLGLRHGSGFSRIPLALMPKGQEENTGGLIEVMHGPGQ